ncbi:MAG: hypothetical protein J7L53_12625 [Deltaproteobacteria bacterium]|nr:hypothetical protein [Deltaproteobacteria bacterium]
MKGAVKLSVIVVLLATLSGCIISAVPDPDETIYLDRLKSQVFLVIATNIPYPSNTSMVFNWYVDDELKDTANPVYLFTAWPEYFGKTVGIECVVEVWQHNPSGDDLLWSGSRTWTVVVD